MVRALTICAVVILVLHGLIHLMGVAVYTKLGVINGLVYKTTLLGGRWDVGETGIRLFGASWLIPALGFVVAAAAIVAGYEWWRDLLVLTTVISLVLTALDWTNAFAGSIVDIAILTVILAIRK